MVVPPICISSDGCVKILLSFIPMDFEQLRFKCIEIALHWSVVIWASWFTHTLSDP